MEIAPEIQPKWARTMAETLTEQAIAIGQRNYAVFKVQATYGDFD